MTSERGLWRQILATTPWTRAIPFYPRPIIQPLRLNPQFPFSCSLLSTTLHNAYPPYQRSFDICLYVYCKCQQIKKGLNDIARWILSKILWLKFVLSKYFREFLILPIHACLILLRGSIDPSNPKAILESPNINPAKEAEAKMTGRPVANLIFHHLKKVVKWS